MELLMSSQEKDIQGKGHLYSPVRELIYGIQPPLHVGSSQYLVHIAVSIALYHTPKYSL